MYIPLSAYSDLGDPATINLIGNSKQFRIMIEGGDASTMYKAELIFVNGVIQKRKTVLSEFENEVWEETHYSFNLSNLNSVSVQRNNILKTPKKDFPLSRMS